MTDAQRDLLQRAHKRYEITPNTHKGLQTQFGKQFVKAGTFPPEMGRNLRRIFDLRQKADYSGVDLSEEAVRNVLERADAFVRTVESYLEAGSDA